MYDGRYQGVPAATLNEFLRKPPTPTAAEQSSSSSSSSSKDLVGVRLGIMRAWFDDCAPAVRDVAWAAVAALVARGASVVDVVRCAFV